MIHLLCPTIRPDTMKAVIAEWLAAARDRNSLRLKFAVNTEADRAKLAEFDDVLVVGDKRRGACYAVYRLGVDLKGAPGDLVVLVCDDTFPVPAWDDWLRGVFDGHDDAVIVNDGGQFGPCATQPMMTYGCLLKINRLICHPSYHHFCADAELYANLVDLGLGRNVRQDGPLFEHRNWAWNKRVKDQHDEHNLSLWDTDRRNMLARLRLPVAQRLIVEPKHVEGA